MSYQIQFRRDTAANWTSANTLLAAGELGIETDTLKTKVGDGATHWMSLSYSSVATVSPSFTGTPTAPTQTRDDNSTKLATTAYADRAGSKRVLALSAGSATPSINTDTYDIVHITAQSAAITSFTTNLTGTPVDGDELFISITDDGTARAITWGSKFEAGTVPLPATTVISTRFDIQFVWNTVTSKWRSQVAPGAITQTALDNSTNVATTAYVDAAVAVGSGRYKVMGVQTSHNVGTNTTTPQSVGSFTIPGNDAVALGKYQITAYGSFSSGSSGFNMTFSVSIGGTVLFTQVLQPVATNQFSQWKVVVTLIPVTIGGSATWIAFMDITAETQAAAGAWSAIIGPPTGSTGTTTKDSTASQAFAVTAASGGSSGGVQVECLNSYCERLA
jgi:hypothetical protein